MIKKLLQMPQKELAIFILEFATKHNYDVDYKEQAYIIINKKDKTPVLVSHLDIVGKKIPRKIKQTGSILKNPHGVLGGDDRCGVYIMLKLMEMEFRNYTYIFCFNEEKGCSGSSKLKPNFEPICLIGLDRRGFNDCALYEYDNEDLINIFKNYGYEPINGSITDVAVLAPKFNVACINLSVGFYNEHTKDEYINLHATHFTLDVLTDRQLQQQLTEKFEIQYDYFDDYWGNGTLYNYYQCEYCGAHSRDLIEFEDLFVCDHCYDYLKRNYHTKER